MKISLIQMKVTADKAQNAAHAEELAKRASGADVIRIDSIFQKAKIILNEHGTKAAAATAIEFGITAFMPEIRREVYLDKPFFYVIVNGDGIPLFIGTVEDPTK